MKRLYCGSGEYKHKEFDMDKVKAASRIEEGGYILEVAIPIREIKGLKAKYGETIGFQIVLSDSDSPAGGRKQEVVFSPSKGAYWADQTTFGKLTFK